MPGAPGRPARAVSLRTRALGFLARREHTSAELRRKLAPHAESTAELDTLLDDLVRRRLLSEERYAESRAHTLTRKFGAARIERELRARGVAQTVAASAAAAARASEFERAQEIWRRKFGTLPRDRSEQARQARFLMGRGFSAELVRRILRQPEE